MTPLLGDPAGLEFIAGKTNFVLRGPPATGPPRGTAVLISITHSLTTVLIRRGAPRVSGRFFF